MSKLKYETRPVPADIDENVKTILKIIGVNLITDESKAKKIRKANRKLIFNRLPYYTVSSMADKQRAIATLENLSD